MGCNGTKQPSREENPIVIRSKNPQEQEKPLEIKVVLLGDQHVGKSSIALRYCESTFSPIGDSYFRQRVVLSNGTSVKFHIWDAGGQYRFRGMAYLYFKDLHAVILNYDITNEQTFTSLEYWIQELTEKGITQNILLVLAGNKCDLPANERKVTTAKAQEFANTHQMIFFETSAKNNIGITDLFTHIAKKIYELNESNESQVIDWWCYRVF